VAKFLSDEWLETVRSSAGDARADDLSVRLLITVGAVQVTAVLVDGALEDLALGGRGDEEVTLTLVLDDAVAIQRGDLQPSVAFMQGRMKTAGDPGKVLDILACTARPGFARLRDEVAAATEL
jgi:hypothetical protein